MKKIIFITMIILVFASCKKTDDPKPVSDKSVSYTITIVNNRSESYTLAYKNSNLTNNVNQTVNSHSTFVLKQTFTNGVPEGDDQKIYIYNSSNVLSGSIYWGNGNPYTVTWN